MLRGIKSESGEITTEDISRYCFEVPLQKNLLMLFFSFSIFSIFPNFSDRHSSWLHWIYYLPTRRRNQECWIRLFSKVINSNTLFVYKQINGFNYQANFHASSRYSHPYPQEPEVCTSKDSLCDLLHPLLSVHPSQVELVCFALRKNSVAESSSCGRKRNTIAT